METFWSIGVLVISILFFCAFSPTGKNRCTVCGTDGLEKDMQFYHSEEIASAYRPLKAVGFYCSNCAHMVEEAVRLTAAAKANAPTQTWPATYKGKI